jgi:hypothetical protein
MLEDNIEIDLREIGWGGMDWIDLAQAKGPVESPCEYGNEPSGSIKCLENFSLLNDSVPWS